MKNIYTIAKYTFIEALRDKFTWLVFALMLAGIPIGLFIRTITLFGEQSSYPAAVLAVMSVSLIAVSVLYVNIATRRELDGRIMLVILSSPMPNWMYLGGKHLGFWAVATMYVLFAGVLTLVLGIGGIQAMLAYAFGLWLMQAVAIAWSLFFALLLNSMAASVIASLLAWALSNSIQTLYYMGWRSADVATKVISNIFYYIMPNYNHFDFKHAVLYDQPVPAVDLAILPVYTLIYTGIILILAWIDFSRKEY